MVRIRLSLHGRKHLPHYRIVIIHNREKRESRSIEEVGYYNPITKEVKIEKERVKYWLSVGAQPSDRVAYLLVKEGMMDKPTFKKKFAGKPGKKTVAREEAKAAKQAAEAKKLASVEATAA